MTTADGKKPSAVFANYRSSRLDYSQGKWRMIFGIVVVEMGRVIPVKDSKWSKGLIRNQLGNVPKISRSANKRLITGFFRT